MDVSIASVASFTLTVPTNLYAYPIEIKLQDVRVTLVQTSSGAHSDRHSATTSSKARAEEQGKAPEATDADREHLPTTYDLAQSFLDQEPREEKAQLAAEVATQSVDLSQSTSSLDNDDEALGYGYADGLSLPAFLTTFLKAVLDRVIVKVEDITVEADFMPGASGFLSQHDIASIGQKAAVGVRIQLESISSPGAGLQNITQAAAAGSVSPDFIQLCANKPSKRLVVASGLSVSVKSSSAVFDAWDKVIDKDDSRRERVSPTHSWTDAPKRTDPAHAPQPRLHAASSSVYAQSNDTEIDELHPPASSAGPQPGLALSPSGITQRSKYVKAGASSGLDSMYEESKTSQLRTSSPGGEALSLHQAMEEAIPDPPISRSLIPSPEELPAPVEQSQQLQSVDIPDDVSETSAEQEEPLLESRVFTSQEAESLYVSVLEPEADPSTPFFGRYTAKPEPVASSEDNPVPQATSSPGFEPLARSVDPDNRPRHGEPDTYSGQSSSEMMSKCILTLDRLSAWLPGAGETPSGDPAPPLDGAKRTPDRRAETMPGAFSIHVDAHEHEPPPSPIAPSSDKPHIHRSRDAQGTNGCSIDGGAATVHLDLSLCAMMSHLAQHVTKLFDGSVSDKGHDGGTTPAAATSQVPQIEASLSSFKVLLKDNLNREGQNTSSHFFSQSTSASRNGLDLVELQASLINAKLGSSGLEHLSIGDIAMSLVGVEVMRMGPSSCAQTLLKSPHGTINTAVSLTASRRPNAMELEVSTSPVRLDIDLFRLDENLAMLGGFSGLIGVGSMVLSEASQAASPKIGTAPGRPRSVRFETLSSDDQQMPSGQLKLNLRVGAMTALIRGKSKTLRCETSAVKIVHRAYALGVQVDRVAATWPDHVDTTGAKPFYVGLDNVGFKLLPKPEEQDLSRLVALVAPSKARFDDQDDLLLPILVQQRRNGAVARVSCSHVRFEADDLSHLLSLQQFGTDLAGLSNISRYLPKESRPGMLMVGSVGSVGVSLAKLGPLGSLHAELDRLEFAHVGAPLLIATTCHQFNVSRHPGTAIVRPFVLQEPSLHPFMLMMRFVGEEVNPTARLKIFNTCLEYDPQLVSDMEQFAETQARSSPTTVKQPGSSTRSKRQQPLGLSIELLDCCIGLNPRSQRSKGLFIVTEARFSHRAAANMSSEVKASVKKGSMLLVNDTSTLSSDTDQRLSLKSANQSVEGIQLSLLTEQGYVPVAWISAAEGLIKIPSPQSSRSNHAEVEIRDPLLVLETCPDSQQTLTALLGALQPPPRPSPPQDQYRTEVAPLPDMIASFSGDAYALPTGASSDEASALLEDSALSEHEAWTHHRSSVEPRSPSLTPEASVVDDFSTPGDSDHFSSSIDFADSEKSAEILSGGLNVGPMPEQAFTGVGVWDSKTNRFVPVARDQAKCVTSSVCLRNAHFIWNLYDGYDWMATRVAVSRAVQEVQRKATEKRQRQQASARQDEDDEPVINDFLFNSIYIGVPVSKEPRDLSNQISRDIDDDETDMTSLPEAPPKTPAQPVKDNSLHLKRSRRQKLAFELRGISVDALSFDPKADTITSLSLSVQDFEIFDHVPTSTWKKFATYQHDTGGREESKSMAKIEICIVAPNPSLSTSELVIRVSP